MPEFLSKLIPPLSNEVSKGYFGRIVVVGGCLEYTGAPYFTALSALKTGADLAYVLCTNEAAIPIKAYSPELIVYPILSEYEAPNSRKLIEQVLVKAHIVVIGPGLGRSEDILRVASLILLDVQKRKIPCILDGDAIFMLSREISIISGASLVAITPNQREFSLICKALSIDHQAENAANLIIEALPGVLLILKGQNDLIMANDYQTICSVAGSLRRCGGQGDILAGVLATFLHWLSLKTTENTDNHINRVIAGSNACTLVRMAAKATFAKHSRGTLASDIIEQLPLSLNSLMK